jgi:hypothetical protein
MAMGKSYYNRAFADPELLVLAPKLAKGLATASAKERVAYCLTADYSADERFITTGWVYYEAPYLHFKLVEWRTPVRVNSPATPTAEACLVKPIPGTKTADRFFQLEYEPRRLIVTHGPMGKSIYDRRGEVVFKLAGLDITKLLEAPGQNQDSAQNVSKTLERPPSARPAVRADDNQMPGVPQPESSNNAGGRQQGSSKSKAF